MYQNENFNFTAILPKLCSNLVRLDEAGGRADQDQVLRSLARTNPGSGAALQLKVIQLLIVLT